MELDEYLLNYWQTLECKIMLLGIDVPCDQTGWWPEEQGTWLFPITPSSEATGIDVYIVKMGSNGTMSQFPIQSEFITLSDIEYIAQQRPEASALLKLFYTQQLFDEALSTPIP